VSGDRIDALGQRLFQAAREERPDAALHERVRELANAARASSVAPPVSGARAATRWGARPARLWLAAGALSAAAALWLLVGEGLGERTLERETEVLISAEARPPVVGVERLPVTEVTMLPTTPTRVPSASPPSSEPAAALSAPSAPSAPVRAAAPRAAVPRATTASPRAAAPLSQTHVQAPEAPPAKPSASARSAPLAQQLELLKQARSLLRSGQPTEALTVLDRYESELGGTDLRDEAALLRIEALAAQGRAADAEALARRFVVEHPDSPLAERAQRLGGIR
jgi:hypothetical protein